MMTKTLRAARAAVLLCAAVCLALAMGLATLRAASGQPVKDTPAATAAVSMDAADADNLRPHVGETVEVHGTPTATGQSKSGNVFYLNFAPPHHGVAIVFFGKSSSANGVLAESDLKQYLGKNVSVTGKLADFKGDLQIVVDTADQIKILPTP